MKKINYHHPALLDTLENQESGFIETEVHNEVCPECNGFGVHDRKDIDCSQLVDDMREDGDEEGLASYFRGEYDQMCEICSGNRVILVPDELPEWAVQAIDQWEIEVMQDKEYAAQERAMGA